MGTRDERSQVKKWEKVKGQSLKRAESVKDKNAS